jgi:hypothetical protein
MNRRAVLGIGGRETMEHKHNAVQRLLLPEQIHQRIRELASEIRSEYAGKHPVLVGVLKGAFCISRRLGTRAAVSFAMRLRQAFQLWLEHRNQWSGAARA